jgi:hypothetical protein
LQRPSNAPLRSAGNLISNWALFCIIIQRRTYDLLE